MCRGQPAWFLPHVDQILGDLGEINQPSVQWHVAQMAQHLHDNLSKNRVQRAVSLLQRNLSAFSDWIVLNVTMDVLSAWAEQDRQLADWLKPQLERLLDDARKSVAKRAAKRLAALSD